MTDKEAGTPEFLDELECDYDVKYEEERFARREDFAGKKLLEVGCDRGGDLSGYARNGAIVTVVDFHESGVTPARWCLPTAVSRASSEDLPFENSSFHLVVIIGVLRCAVNIQKATEEI